MSHEESYPEHLRESAGVPRWFYAACALLVLAVIVAPGPTSQYVLMGALCLAFLSCYVTSPERTILVYIFLFPAMKFAPAGSLIVPGLNFETIATLALGAAAVMSRGHQIQPPPRNPFTAPVLFYVILIVVSVLLSYLTESAQGHRPLIGYYPLPPSSYMPMAKNTVIAAFLAPIAFRLLWGRKQLLHATYMVGCATVLVSLEAASRIRESVMAGEIGGLVRAEGLLVENPNLLGGFLAMMTVVFAPFVLTANLSRTARGAGLIALIGAGGGLALTFSRGAWLGALAGLIYLGIFTGARIAAALLVLAALTTMLIPPQFVERFESALKVTDTVSDPDVKLDRSTRSRVIQWSNLPGQWFERPLIGHGFRSYGKIGGMFTRHGTAKSAHSTIIQMTVEEGLAGLIAYFWLLWVLWRGAWRVSRRSRDPFLRALSSGYAGAILCLVVLDMSGTRFPHSAVMTYTWILGGGLGRMAWNLEQEQDEPAPRPKPRYPQSAFASRAS